MTKEENQNSKSVKSKEIKEAEREKKIPIEGANLYLLSHRLVLGPKGSTKA